MAVRQHRWTISLLPLVAAVGIAALFRASLPIRDWNPYLTDAGELAGDWRDGRAVLRLHANGRYVCDGAACQALGATGSWKRSGDFFVAFQPDRPATPWSGESAGARVASSSLLAARREIRTRGRRGSRLSTARLPANVTLQLTERHASLFPPDTRRSAERASHRPSTRVSAAELGR